MYCNNIINILYMHTVHICTIKLITIIALKFYQPLFISLLKQILILNILCSKIACN